MIHPGLVKLKFEQEPQEQPAALYLGYAYFFFNNLEAAMITRKIRIGKYGMTESKWIM
jgi:hypothetical protein